MNVTDVKDYLKHTTEDRLELMITQQKQLMTKYHEIEAKMRLTSDCPVDLDDSRGQLLLKDFAWRTTEEIAEALSALIEEGGPDTLVHAQEEVADALHFLLEFIVLAGAEQRVTIKVEGENGDSLDYLFNDGTFSVDYLFSDGTFPETARTKETLELIRQLGMVCHTLKNKPWKQSHMLTDKNEFYGRLFVALTQFCRMATTFGMDSEKLFEMYFRKAQVNLFRQRSQY
jgi:hypothetical protein